MDLIINDIVIYEGNIYQYLGKEMENGVVLQDIHTYKKLVHINLVERKANTDEVKWFCEKTENIYFIPPKK